jgi:uncharacterized damage-inducible protein DinB
MKDPAFIDRILAESARAELKTNALVKDISLQQLNYKTHPSSWSIAECLHHLIRSDSSYFPVFEKIREGEYKKSSWQKISPLTGFFGNFMNKNLTEDVKKKMKAPSVFRHTQSGFDLSIIADYRDNFSKFTSYIDSFRNLDLTEIVISSPVSAFITYTLRDALCFLLQHEHRHLNQATRVKAQPGFAAMF